MALGGVSGVVFAIRSSPPLTRDQRWQQDIAFTARELPRLRAGGLDNVSRAAWNAATARLEAKVPRLTDGQLTVGLARLVATLGDDETQVGIGDRQFYPVLARWFGGDLYVMKAPAADRALLGARLLALDGMPIAHVMARIGSTIGAEDPTLRADTELSYLRNPALLDWLGITSTTAGAVLSVEPAAGGVRTFRVVPVTSWDGAAQVPQPLYEQDQLAPYWMRILAGQRAVYLKYNQCVNDDGFQRLAARAIAALQAHPGYRLIVDMRNNGGGDSYPFQALINDIRIVTDINQPGRVIGLVNQFTDSSATVDAQSLKADTKAVLIGQAVADPIDAWGNEQFLTLPGSALAIEYTTAAVNTTGTLWGIPDVTVAPTISQVLAGDDPVLAMAVSYTPGLPVSRKAR